MRVKEKPQTLLGGEHVWVKLAPLVFGTTGFLYPLVNFSRVLPVVADGNVNFFLRQVAFSEHPFWTHIFVRFHDFPHVEGGAFTYARLLPFDPRYAMVGTLHIGPPIQGHYDQPTGYICVKPC